MQEYLHDFYFYFFFQIFAYVTQLMSLLVLTARVYLRTGYVMELMIVQMEVMKLLIVDLNVVSIRYSPYGSQYFLRYSVRRILLWIKTISLSEQILNSRDLPSLACEKSCWLILTATGLVYRTISLHICSRFTHYLNDIRCSIFYITQRIIHGIEWFEESDLPQRTKGSSSVKEPVTSPTGDVKEYKEVYIIDPNNSYKTKKNFIRFYTDLLYQCFVFVGDITRALIG